MEYWEIERLATTHKVLVLEIDDFCKTEFGEEVFCASRLNSAFKEEITKNGYAIKRGDKWFLVKHLNTRFVPRRYLEIESDHIIYPLKENGKLDDYDIWSHTYFGFDYKERLNKIIFTPRTDTRIEIDEKDYWTGFTHPLHTKTLINVGYGRRRTDNGIFKKFIEPDSHWLECSTHRGSRQEVLSGNGKSIFDEAERAIMDKSEEKDEKTNFIVRGVKHRIQGYLNAREINNRTRD